MTVDRDEIRRAVALLVEPGSVVEVRAPLSRRGTLSGYFDDTTALVNAVAALNGEVPGVYLTLNPVHPALLARARNRIAAYARDTTSDPEVIARRWVLVDFDPVRPSGISSTDAEHFAALDAARACRSWLVETLGFSTGSLVLADSGNGAHALIRANLPNIAAATMLVRRCLEAIALYCNTEAIQVDTTVHNAARIVKLYGTVTAKGDPTADRPHRLARILEAPSLVVEPISRALLDRLAALRPEEPRGTQRPARGDFDVHAWLAGHGVQVVREKPWTNGATVLELAACPVGDHAHHRGEAVVILCASGMLLYRCLHHTCAGVEWSQLREHFDGPREHRQHARARRSDELSWPADDGPPRCEAGATDMPWPDPVPLEGVEVPPFPIDALPTVLADMVRDVAAVTQTPLDLAGSMGLGVLGAAGSRRADVAIGLTSNPTHVEPLNLYIACVAASGTRKGPAQRAMSAPLRALERERRKEMTPKIAEARQRRRATEKHLERLTDQAAKAETAESEKLTQQAEQLACTLPVVPVMPTLIVSDRTTEKLELDLAEQDGALLLEDEEAGTLFAIAGGRYSRDGSVHVDVFLKAYDRGTIDTARIGRDPVHIETPELSINVTPQPIILQQLRERPEFHHRGFLPRFLFAVPPSLVGSRRYDETVAPNSAIRAAYGAKVKRLCTALPKKHDGEDLAHLRIEGPALAVWKQYERRVEQEQREGERLAPIREWASKQAGRVARIAGDLYLGETVDGDSVDSVNRSPTIPAHTMEAACRLGEYFEAHALAAYDVMGTLPIVDGARRVLAWIKREDCSVTFSERDAARALGVGRNRFFPEMDDLRRCLRLLVEHGYLRQMLPPEHPGPGQKPSPIYEVNPKTLRSCRQNRQNSPLGAAAVNSVDSVNTSECFRAGIEGVDSREPGSDDDDPTPVQTPLTEGDVLAMFGGQIVPPGEAGEAFEATNSYAPSATTPPTVACRVCGGTTWHWAGSDWTCSTCHPTPHAPPARQQSPLDDVGRALVTLAERHGWSTAHYRQGHSVGGDEARWRRFAAHGLLADKRAALRYLEALPTVGEASR
jgi:hypothetical protein